VVPPAKFSDFVVPRITDMTQIAVHAVPSADGSTNKGEPGLAPLNPASAAAGR
jgi:isoquinoline 1-oxidoreductase beta subunit